MRNFSKLAEGLQVRPLLQAIMQQPELWNQERLRTTFPGSPHSEVDDIWLRFNDVKKWEAVGEQEQIMHDHANIWYPAAARLPQARPFIFDLMRLVEGEQLGRVIITRLAPGKKIARHADSGAHAEFYDRYHLVLQCLPGCNFEAGGEVVGMKGGDCWWFDNSKEHEVVNNSTDDRLTMIIDIRTLR